MQLFSTSNYKNFISIVVLLLADIVAYFIAFGLAIGTAIMFHNIGQIHTYSYTSFGVILQSWWFLIIFLFILASFGLYTSRLPFWTEAKQLVKSVFISFIVSLAIVSIGKYYLDVYVLVVVLLWCYALITLPAIRYFIKTKLSKCSFYLRRAVIIGNYKDAYQIAKSFEKETCLGFEIVGVVTIKKSRSVGKEIRILGNIEDIRKIVSKEDINIAVFTPAIEDVDNLFLLIGRLQIMLSQVIFIPNLSWLAFSNAETIQTFVTRLSYYQINNNLKSFLNRFTKRTIDIALCIISLPFLLLITLVIGIIIKSSSKGPIFYAHRRVGRFGKKIWILKFRSMYRNADERLQEILMNDPNAKAEWDKTFKLKDDPRITHIGRFLRRTSLDELPQVFNVITGDMSLIGPRPVIQDELDLFYKDFSSYYLMMRPGLTGLWQISGRSDSTYDFRVARDTWYVLNWSVWLDLVILLKTPAVVFKRDGAY